ncbi:MAG: phosphatase PAP2 family protein [Gemmatimonadaceae bacterium]
MGTRSTLVSALDTGRRSRQKTLVAAVAAIAAIAVASCSDQPTAPPSAAAPLPSANAGPFDLNSANATLEWEHTARDLVVAHGAAFGPLVAGRAYALLGVAQYGAAVAADDDYDKDGGGRALYEARRGAVAGASAAVLSYLFPDAAAALETQVMSDGNAGPGRTHPQFTRGVATGRVMGALMIDRARSDGFSAAWDGHAAADPLGGGWIGLPNVAPAGFQFPRMTPYYLTSQSQFRPGAPIAQGTPEFDADIAAVRAFQAARTLADIADANFWNLSNGTITALGYWDERAAEYIAAAGMNERDASHVFALMNSAAMDAVVGCWDAKYWYMRLRPSMADPTITRVPGIPGFPYPLPNHPSYPSGHSCVSASAARVIESFFPDATPSLESQVAAAGRSRVVGGIHFPSDVSTGQALGRNVADWAIAYDHAHGLLSAVQR